MKELINGTMCTNFGSNNYSHGMEAVVFTTKEITIDKVMLLPNVFLHPTQKANSLEIYALKGTLQQYLAFTKDAIATNVAKSAVSVFGMDFTDEDRNKSRQDYIDVNEKLFQLWYHEA